MRDVSTTRAVSLLFSLIALISQSLPAQTYHVIYSFTGGQDGASPCAGLTIDKTGNLYGTAEYGGLIGGACGTSGCGTVFRLARRGPSWALSPLYNFAGGNDGAGPVARVAFAPDGSLYGATNAQGNSGCLQNKGCGTVFNLRPLMSACHTAPCPWAETVLYRFTGGSDGGNPSNADLVFDVSGNLYGATAYGGMTGCGGNYGCGVVYELTPSNGGWAESVLYSFTGGNDGGNPGGGVIFDQAGNLYGVASQFGPSNQGTVYELMPSGQGWTQNTLFDFQGEYGTGAIGSLVFDGYGNLFGATQTDNYSPPWYAGTLYEIKDSNSNWVLSYHYDFGEQYPQAGVTMDAAGNLYGVVAGNSGAGIYGSVYQLTPSNGSWSLTNLYLFADGSTPTGVVVLDAEGNVYGTTLNGGAYGNGVVWQITP